MADMEMSGFGYGAALRRHRRRSGLTQDELAGYLGLSPGYISLVEHELRKPSPKTARALADGVGLEGEERESFLDALERAHKADHDDRRKERRDHQLRKLPPIPTLKDPPIGRDSELEEIKGLLKRPGVIVNIAGEPAIGKTTLAMQLANQLHNEGQVVIWGDAREGEAKTSGEVEALLWYVLGRGDMPADPRERLTRIRGALARYEALLVLDNLESALDFTSVVSYIDGIAPPATVLLTSRRQIPGRLGRNVLLQELNFEDGIALFKRIGEQYGRRAETEEDDTIIELICADFLEGHPGAIEIGAALWGTWSLCEILRGLRRKAMEILVDRERTDINRSMRLSIGLSHDLLAKEDTDAFDLFPRLSVFPARFDHRAVRVICETEEPLPLLSLLVSRSLVRFDGQRYGLHAVLRDYSKEILGDSRGRWEHRAVHYFLKYAETHEADLDALEGEKGNLFGMMEWCEEREEHRGLALRFLNLLARFMDRRSYWGERLRRTERLLLICELLGEEDEMARLSLLIGEIHRKRGRLREAEEWMRRGLEAASHAENQNIIGSALFLSAQVVW